MVAFDLTFPTATPEDPPFRLALDRYKEMRTTIERHPEWRERLVPADVGLPAGFEGRRRRTAGLRREEVALLASLSATYYTFLEQGRPVRPSAQVLDALASALRMSAAERRYLHVLAYGPGGAAGQDPSAAAPRPSHARSACASWTQRQASSSRRASSTHRMTARCAQSPTCAAHSPATPPTCGRPTGG